VSAQKINVPRRSLAAALSPITRLFDKLYRSEFNPLYRSGTLAIGMLLLLLITGLYLLLFYRIGSPHASLERIQEQWWLGRWMRSMHRYATDIAIVATVFHILQVVIQGRSWGPRVLAWISGVALTGALLASAWTGYVMVWDQHGQWVAESGARLATVAPFLRDTLLRTFGGAVPLTGSFFFMNLFLHVAVPLVMTIMIWIHTAHLAKPGWFPHVATFTALISALFLVSILMPAPLLESADPRILTGRMPTDLFTGFWLPFVEHPGPVILFALFLLLTLAFATMPWWWQGNRASGPAVVSYDKCTGCSQCSRDCPFEAISMQARTDGNRRLLAVVAPDKCTECGLCIASCLDVAIGLPDETSATQLEWLNHSIPAGSFTSTRPALVYCETNQGIARTLARLRSHYPDLITLGVRCAGKLHADTMYHLLERAPSALLLTCPGENCSNRWGYDLASARLLNRRRPSLDPDFVSRVRVLPESGHAFHAIARELETDTTQPRTPPNKKRAWLRTALAHTLFVAVIAVFSAWKTGTPPEHGVFRAFLTLPGLVVEEQQDWTPEELASTPAHMRLPKKTVRRHVNYTLSILVDGHERYSRSMHTRRDGRDIRIAQELELDPGSHRVAIRLLMDTDNTEHILLDDTVTITRGHAELFEFNGKTLLADHLMQMRKNAAPEPPPRASETPRHLPAAQ